MDAEPGPRAPPRSMTAQPSLSEAKAQHYIPKFYLKGFTDSNSVLWVYERFKPPKASSPKGEAHKPDYYTHAEQGQRDETAESELEAIESRAAPVVRKLANHHFVPSPEQMGHLYLFVALMFARVPSWRGALDQYLAQFARDTQLSNAKDRDRFHKQCAEFEKNTGKSLGMDYEELRQYILRGEYEIVQESAAFNLGAMFKSAFTVAGELANYGHEVLYAPEGEFFLTSDSPVFTLQPDGAGQANIGMGFGHSGVEVYFPLNKRACLRLKKGIGPSAVGITSPSIGQINRVTMANATQYLYSSEGYRRISRLFDQWGSKIEPGTNAFLPNPSMLRSDGAFGTPEGVP